MSDQHPIFTLKMLARRLGIPPERLEELRRRAPTLYAPFDLRKEGSTKWRHIDNPRGPLKDLQERITTVFLRSVTLPATMLGGIQGRSARQNAALHVGRLCVVNLDLVDCFPRTHDREVFRVLKHHFVLSDEVAGLLTAVLTLHHYLPQGAPSSSDLANLTMLGMHVEMVAFAAERGLVLSQFVDDVTVSGEDARSAIPGLIAIAAKHKKEFSYRKLKIQGQHVRQTVTGYVVNERVAIPREKVEGTRRQIEDLAARDSVMQTELQRVGGSISYIRGASPKQAERLNALVQERLPKDGEFAPSHEKGDIRPCSGYKRHRAG